MGGRKKTCVGRQIKVEKPALLFASAALGGPLSDKPACALEPGVQRVVSAPCGPAQARETQVVMTGLAHWGGINPSTRSDHSLTDRAHSTPSRRRSPTFFSNGNCLPACKKNRPKSKKKSAEKTLFATSRHRSRGTVFHQTAEYQSRRYSSCVMKKPRNCIMFGVAADRRSQLRSMHGCGRSNETKRDMLRHTFAADPVRPMNARISESGHTVPVQCLGNTRPFHSWNTVLRGRLPLRSKQIETRPSWTRRVSIILALESRSFFCGDIISRQKTSAGFLLEDLIGYFYTPGCAHSFLFKFALKNGRNLAFLVDYSCIR